MKIKRATRQIVARYALSLVLLLLALFFVGWVAQGGTNKAHRASQFISNNLAAAYFTLTTTTDALRDEFLAFTDGAQDADPIHVAIMPGHEPGYGGAVYKDIYEREMNVELAEYLERFFEEDEAFDVTVLRTNKLWLPELQKYFDEHRQEIEQYIADQKELTQQLLDEEQISFADSEDMFHGNAPSDVAYRLYAVNHWASNNDIDVVLHIHFNDTASRNVRKQDPSGFAIYVPHSHYSNHEPSQELAEYIFKRLEPWYVASNNTQELDGIIPNHKLIALGSRNTLEKASLLIEYGYIYEHKFRDPQVRQEIIFDLALQTYWGVKDFFEGVTPTSTETAKSGLYARIPDTSLPLKKQSQPQPENVALQALLHSAGVYPPTGKDLRSCPIDGIFGNCTLDAVRAFQRQYDITVDGMVGEETLDRLYEKPRDEYRSLLNS